MRYPQAETPREVLEQAVSRMREDADRLDVDISEAEKALEGLKANQASLRERADEFEAAYRKL